MHWTSDLEVGGWRPNPCHRVVSLDKKLCPSLSQSPPRCISGYWRHTAGDNPAIDNHPIQGGVAILSVASCYRNQDKLWPFGPPWLVCNFAYSEWFAIILWGGYLSNGCRVWTSQHYFNT